MFRIRVRKLYHGWCEVVMYINDKCIICHAGYLGQNPIASLIDVCSELKDEKYSTEPLTINWEEEPGGMEIELERNHAKNDMLHLYIYDKYEGKEWDEEVKFQDFVDAIISEGFRVLNAFGLYGYRRSWMTDIDFPVTNLLHITGKCKKLWKNDSCCTNLAEEIECINEYVTKPQLTDETSYPECLVYYESWQMQCCGDRFSVGDEIKWGCILPSEYKNAHGYIMDFEEEHHGFQTHEITGAVSRIIAERSEFPKGKQEICYHKAECIHQEQTQADGRESIYRDTDEAEYTFWGYIVELKDVIVKPIVKDTPYKMRNGNDFCTK